MRAKINTTCHSVMTALTGMVTHYLKVTFASINMPEFEENNSQTNSTYSYTPSTSTSKNKGGGRRRSGGFKSEATAITPKIGEVDPTEALKAEKTKKNNPPASEVSEKKESRSVKTSKASSKKHASEKTTKATDLKPQPSKETLNSIKSVEEKIARRRAENEKNRPVKKESVSKKKNVRTHKQNKSSDQGGLLAAIGQFFGKLLGNSTKAQPPKGRGQTSKGQKSKSQRQNSRRGPRRDSSGNRHKGNRSAPGNRRNNKSKSS